MRLDKDAAELMDFRHEAFEKQMKEINDIVTGRDTELSAFINDENGNISNERIDQLISDLIGCLINYHKQRYSNLTYRLSDETRELYECFLYCTIQGVALVDVDILQYTMVRRVTTFSDIMDMLHNSDTYNTLEDLLYVEQLGYPIASSCRGFFNSCDLAYQILTDSSIVNAFTDEENSFVLDLRERETASSIDNNEYYTNDDDDDYFMQVDREQLDQEPEPSYEDLYDRLYGIPSEDEKLISDYELELCEKVEASHNEWKKSVVDPDKFISKYLRYRELYFSINHSSMINDIEKMINAFLYEQGLSSFSLGEKYVMMIYHTRRYRNALKSEIRKARCK